MQRDLDQLRQWADKWQMDFNSDKCEVMHFGRLNQDVELPALDWGKHSKSFNNTRLKSNRFIQKTNTGHGGQSTLRRPVLPRSGEATASPPEPSTCH